MPRYITVKDGPSRPIKTIQNTYVKVLLGQFTQFEFRNIQACGCFFECEWVLSWLFVHLCYMPTSTCAKSVVCIILLKENLFYKPRDLRFMSAQTWAHGCSRPFSSGWARFLLDDSIDPTSRGNHIPSFLYFGLLCRRQI